MAPHISLSESTPLQHVHAMLKGVTNAGEVEAFNYDESVLVSSKADEKKLLPHVKSFVPWFLSYKLKVDQLVFPYEIQVKFKEDYRTWRKLILFKKKVGKSIE